MVENVPPAQVWKALNEDPQAQLVDVRTEPEWAYVGLPDLSAAGKKPLPISWQLFPTMQVNAKFVELLRDAGLDEVAPHLLPLPQRRAQPGRGERGDRGGVPARLQHRRRVRRAAGPARPSRHGVGLEGRQVAVAAAVIGRSRGS